MNLEDRLLNTWWCPKLCYLIAWIMVGIAFAKTPQIAPLWFALAFAWLVQKSIALVAGIRWIFLHGQAATEHLDAATAGFTEANTPPERRRPVLEYISDHNLSYAPFGVQDWSWRQQIDDDTAPGVPIRQRMRGRLKQVARAMLFRYEAQIVSASILLVLAPYSADGEFSQWSEIFAFGVALIVLSNMALMAFEILAGNAIMRDGYSRYFHLGLSKPPFVLTKGRSLLRELYHFSRLAVFFLIGNAAICLTYFGCRNSFDAILTSHPNGAGFDELWNRLRLFCEFLSFMTTTFSTVGYGDVHPTGIGSRMLVSTIQLIGMGYILGLLQVLFSQRDDRCTPAVVLPPNGQQAGEDYPYLP